MNPILLSISYFVDQFYRYPFNQELAFKTLRDSLSTGQMKSKAVIIEICKAENIKSESAVFIGHWQSLLALMMKNENRLKKAIGVEKSDLWSDFSNYLNRDWKSHNIAIENFDIPLETDLVINTSCEHMSDDWFKKIPTGCRVLIQSTDFDHLEHINKKDSLQDFEKSLVDIQIISRNETNCDIYRRFTVYGIKK